MKTYSLSCKDLGMPQCNFVAKGETKEEVMEMINDHAMKVHAEEMKEKMKSMSKKDMEEMMMDNMKEEDADEEM